MQGGFFSNYCAAIVRHLDSPTLLHNFEDKNEDYIVYLVLFTLHKIYFNVSSVNLNRIKNEI